MSDQQFSRKERVEMCKKCPELAFDSICMKCGCIIFLKTKIPTHHCPLNKW